MIGIIPAIDIIGGKCVRLTKGDYSTAKSYSDNPSDMAISFRDAGLKKLHIVDLDGAKASSPQNLAVLESIKSATDMEIEWGGGIKDRQSLEAVLSCGASQAICGSIAVTDREEFTAWLHDYGPERIILGADARNGRIATHGWMNETDYEVTAHACGVHGSILVSYRVMPHMDVFANLNSFDALKMKDVECTAQGGTQIILLNQADSYKLKFRSVGVQLGVRAVF